MNIAVIKYNAGNIHSVRLALQRLGIDPLVTDDLQEIRSADKVIFPGVGEASSAMENIRRSGIADLIPLLTQPVLGICLGLQLLCRNSEENSSKCLGIFNTDVRRFPPDDKVPHMGWNQIRDLKGDLFRKVDPDAYVYFVHSYYAELDTFTIATTDYILPFSAAMQQDNFYAVQFHPEKSGTVGEQILRNFLAL
ncbi:imidazole glycerol phosphate synthase subunit HisH [bacterium]|nr:imidazole glycerol phosphate synthase subunit HisH [bacterium]MBU1064537.1 imidazole glycerol phosphate synthase subunit HisH [bacterium]MBU1633425.1 imidazole glycerol phosphate synthase subunit HisH [bacterium]MBU1873355.1 imidazole glycerol phosphate synthase subunit HisH [bacterium]